jgi:predicted nucleotidyltransferase/DNA-binding MarR family transcriptional regulator
MHLGAPHLVVLSPAEGGVLAVLAGTERPLSGREVARIGGQPRSTVARVLRRLVEHGVVEAREAGAGATLLYLLNREHLATEPLEALITLRSRLIARIRDELAMWSLRPFHASLFGSTARGDGNTRSDIDLFLVRPMGVPADDPNWREQLDRLTTRIERWTGNRASLADISLDDVARLARERPPVVRELEHEAITLEGPPAHKLLAGTIT